MTDHSDKIKHLEFIQNIITRMNSNSFMIKNWTVAIVSAIFAVAIAGKNIQLLFVAYFPTLLFWFLDAYFLQQERKFRGLYNDVAGVSKEPQNIPVFAMRPDLYTKKVKKQYCFWDVFTSVTILPFYVLILVILCVTIGVKPTI